MYSIFPVMLIGDMFTFVPTNWPGVVIVED